ncbi:hypothetical protein [Paraburkholderia sp. CI3]|uniref:hypothetical protein n=1 Tax=Paraburkholderia sp. CI3 TaxID=2991060 RepID=UPI003D1996C7
MFDDIPAADAGRRRPRVVARRKPKFSIGCQGKEINGNLFGKITGDAGHGVVPHRCAPRTMPTFDIRPSGDTVSSIARSDIEVSNMTWTYRQTSGNLSRDGNLVARGYSGNGASGGTMKKFLAPLILVCESGAVGAVPGNTPAEVSAAIRRQGASAFFRSLDEAVVDRLFERIGTGRAD